MQDRDFSDNRVIKFLLKPFLLTVKRACLMKKTKRNHSLSTCLFNIVQKTLCCNAQRGVRPLEGSAHH